MREIIVNTPHTRRVALDEVAKLDPNTPHVVTIKQYRRKRTRSQNSLMWARYDEIAHAIHEQTGADKEDIHEYCKEHFCPPTVREFMGETITVHSTRYLDTKQMTEFMDKVEAWAATEWGITLKESA